MEWANILDGLKTNKPHLTTENLTAKTETSDQAGSGTGFRRTGKINEEKEKEADSLWLKSAY